MFDRGIEIKTPAQIESMRGAGFVVASTLDLLRTSAVAGMSTAELDVIAHDHIRSQGAASNFLGYHGFTIVTADGALVAYAGKVLSEDSNPPYVLDDPERTIERLLLGTAQPHVTTEELRVVAEALDQQ